MQELQLHRLPKRRAASRNLIADRTVSDLVNRDFTATGPNQLWVTDITEHPTKEGRFFAALFSMRLHEKLCADQSIARLMQH